MTRADLDQTLAAIEKLTRAKTEMRNFPTSDTIETWGKTRSTLLKGQTSFADLRDLLALLEKEYSDEYQTLFA